MSGIFGGGSSGMIQAAPPVPTLPPPPAILMNPPAPQAPAPIPDPTSPAVLEAQRQSMAAAFGTAGRSSTVLSRPATRSPRPSGVATADYSRSTLGAG